MRAIVQKAVVRVISSELDRRSASLEHAVRDAHARMDVTEASTAALATSNAELVRSTQSSLQAIGAAHERMTTRLDELTERIRRGEDADRGAVADHEQLRFDVAAAQCGLADVTGVIERLTQAG